MAVSAIATFALLSFLGNDETDAGLHPVRRPSAGDGAITSPSPTTAEQSPRFATLDGVNGAAGYAFAYPPTWTLRTNETVSRLMSANGDTVVTFGAGVSGRLQDSATALAGLLRDTYDVISMRPARPTTVNGLPAFVVRGSALNADKVKVIFRAFSVRAGGDNFVISVFSRRSTGEVVEEIIESFALTDT